MRQGDVFFSVLIYSAKILGYAPVDNKTKARNLPSLDGIQNLILSQS
jgi:hypothetical protein